MSEIQENEQKKENKLYKNNIRLSKPKQVRLLMARAVNMFNQNKIDYKDLRAVGYIGGQILSAFETVELKERIEKLEELQNNDY